MKILFAGGGTAGHINPALRGELNQEYLQDPFNDNGLITHLETDILE